MDGMSEFDWNIISESFGGIEYEQSAMFAMIPSTTSISRQCLLSGKFPSQLWEPWIQSKEKAEFTACAKALGYTDSQIGYARGYDAEFNAFVKCGAVIINDVDDLVHAQPQGRLGMYNDISVLANEKKLRHLVERLLSNGFDVYITADHGNTQCTGIGKYVGAGVDIETKSHRMLVLKDFADKGKLKDRFGLVEYPKYYLPKEYEYLICDAGTSLDVSGEQVMTHGGMTIDEVVVPFIKIKTFDLTQHLAPYLLKEIERVSNYPTKLILDHMSDISLPTPPYLLDRKVLKVVEKEYSNTKKVAVHLHTFYVDLLEEFLNQFENFHFDYDLFLTTDTEAKKAEIESILEKNGKIAQVFLTGNRGRDIIPMLKLKEELSSYWAFSYQKISRISLLGRGFMEK